MSRCAIYKEGHYYIENGPRIMTNRLVASTPSGYDASRPAVVPWTVEKICTGCGRVAVFDQDGAEVRDTKALRETDA